MKRLLHDRRAVAALETGLVVSLLLLPLLSAVAGAGQALLTQFRLDRALHAALMHGWGAPTANAAVLRSAAQLGYGTASPAMTATASISCYCVTVATGIRESAEKPCTATCASGTVMGTYATVTATAAFAPILAVTWGRAAWTLSATGTARLQ